MHSYGPVLIPVPLFERDFCVYLEPYINFLWKREEAQTRIEAVY